MKRCLLRRWPLLFPAIALVLGALTSATAAQSVFTQRPGDPNAVYLQQASFGAAGDGIADDTAAIQAAIDRVAATTDSGVVFVAEGRYRITGTVHLWSGIRLIGYGAQRPVFVLGPHTPGFQSGHEFLGTGRYMLQFASRKPTTGAPIVDANEFTFYSGISNLDFEIGDGNPAAIAIRFHVAQHSYLSHMNIAVGEGRAGLEDVGNQASDLRITGGEYGIITVRTSPMWQFLLMDSAISGQRRAAIRTEEAGMTLIRDQLSDAPVAIEIPDGKVEQLYARDLLLTHIRVAALHLGDIVRAHHEVTLEHIQCGDVPLFLAADSRVANMTAIRAPSHRYIEEHLVLGLAVASDGRERGVTLNHREVASSAVHAVPSDIPALPEMRDWVSVRALGALGDGGTDDTDALQQAIDQHRTLYFPQGTYRISRTLHLRPDSILIGFNPVTTIVTISDNEAAFASSGEPAPLIESASGGAAIVSGIGVGTGEENPRAVAILWRAGAASLLDDVNLARGHGRANAALAPKLPRTQPAPGSRTAESQGPSLWVKDGGGGLFRDIWTSNTDAAAGLLVEDTSTPSIVYQMSCEHHMHHETQFHRAANWTVYALQTEEENPAGADAFAVELNDAHRMVFANLFDYRVSRNVKPKLNAVEAANSDVLFENMHVFSMTRLAYDNNIAALDSGVQVRSHDFTSFALTASAKPGSPLPLPPSLFEPGAKLRKVASGFSNASGLAADAAGDVFFTDSVNDTILHWSAADDTVSQLTGQVKTPMGVGFATPGRLLAITSTREVFSVDAQSGAATKLDPTASPAPDTSLLMPVGFHNSIETLRMQIERRGIVYAPRSNMAIVARVDDEPRSFFYAPGTSVAIMAGGNWQPELQSSQWTSMHLGDSRLITSEEDDTTACARLSGLRTIAVERFTSRGGTSVVRDSDGNVYVASGQVYVYNAQGKQIAILEVPERPSSLAFGAGDRRTLLIGARSSLYAIRLSHPGAESACR